MKRRIIALCAVFTVLACVPAVSMAAMVSVGASTWYTWWDPSDEMLEFDPFLLYGPVLAVKLSQDFSLSTVLLVGNTGGEVNNDEGLPDDYDWNLKVRRVDNDTALNYSLGSVFKLFAGCKVMWYRVTFNTPDTSAYPTITQGEEVVTTELCVGPAAGLSATFNPFGNVFLMGNVSGMCLRSKYEDDQEGASTFMLYGYNAALSVAYYIPAASTVTALGGRYQAAKSENEAHKNWERFYGVTLSATYSFAF